MGLRIAVDDFGTGYSSLAYLRRFPFDSLKIDRSLVSEVVESSDAASIALAILALAQSLELGTVAEGVETEEQAAFLREAGCRTLQGYLFSRPKPPDELVPLLRSTRSWPLFRWRCRMGSQAGPRLDRIRGVRRRLRSCGILCR